MSNEQPTATGGASSADPVDRIEAWLEASNEDSSTSNQNDAPGDTDADDADAQPAPPDKPVKDAPGENNEPQLTTAQLAQYLGVDESELDLDDDGAPVFKTKIDGKEGAAKFKDLVKSYQLQGHAENRVREAAAKESAAVARLQEAEQVIHQKLQQTEHSLQQVEALSQVARDELMREYQSIDWSALRQQDAGQYAALQQDFQNRNAKIGNVFNEINQRRQHAMQAAQQQQAQMHQRMMAEESKRLTDLIPEWNDKATAEKERQAIREWTIKVGFNPAEVDNITRADLVSVLRRAWQHDTLQQSKPAIENKVRAAPKLVRPGQPQQPSEGAAVRVKALKQNIRNASPANSSKAFEAFLLGTGQA